MAKIQFFSFQMDGFDILIRIFRNYFLYGQHQAFQQRNIVGNNIRKSDFPVDRRPQHIIQFPFFYACFQLRNQRLKLGLQTVQFFRIRLFRVQQRFFQLSDLNLHIVQIRTHIFAREQALQKRIFRCFQGFVGDDAFGIQ